MELAILIGVLLILMALGVPVAFALLGSAIATFIFVGLSIASGFPSHGRGDEFVYAYGHSFLHFCGRSDVSSWGC